MTTSYARAIVGGPSMNSEHNTAACVQTGIAPDADQTVCQTIARSNCSDHILDSEAKNQRLQRVSFDEVGGSGGLIRFIMAQP
jgi:hypothetical protein